MIKKAPIQFVDCIGAFQNEEKNKKKSKMGDLLRGKL